VGLVVVHSYRGGIYHAAGRFPGGLLQEGLEVARALPSGMRGYLLPRLLSLGRRRALALSGLVWAAWHLPLILLSSVFPVGNKLISLPLFVATIVAASFFYGYQRIYTGSVWPASIAHSMHNAAWGTLGAFNRDLLPCDSEQVLGVRLWDTCSGGCRARGHMGWAQVHEGPSGRDTAGGRERRSASGLT
jgi:hypothetical protein